MTRGNPNPRPPNVPPPVRPQEPVQYFVPVPQHFVPGNRQIQTHKFRRQPVPQPRRAAPPIPVPLPHKPVAKPAPPPPTVARPVVAPTKAPTISADSIRQLIRSRPTALRTIFALSEVLMPPLAMRDEKRFG